MPMTRQWFEASKENADTIKIGVIDSGVDNSQCMNVTEFRSFWMSEGP